MLKIGCQLSIAKSKGYTGMGKVAVHIGADVFQFFTRNPRGSRARALDLNDIASFVNLAAIHHIGPVIGHAAYTINPASIKPHRQEFARELIADDLARLEHIPGAYYNLHPGRHPAPLSHEASEQAAATLNAVLKPEHRTLVLLETMAGRGSEVGGRFETLRRIIDSVSLNDKVGVCLDTCHVFAAGYDIVNDLDGVMRDFDAVIGLERLHAVHCNDSKFPLGSGMDRHANIGEGYIGLEGFRGIVNHPALRHVPFYLETDNEPDCDGYGREIALLKNMEISN